MATFGDCWQFAVLHADIPDPLLHRGWCQWAYQTFCDRKGWSHLRAETSIQVGGSAAGTCGVALGSSQVVAGGLTFASAVGRQFRVGSGPVYTIIGLTGANANLHRPYGEITNAGAAGVVLDAYITMPKDFHRFISVADVGNQWRLNTDVSLEQLNRRDPMRMGNGGARGLVPQSLNPTPGALFGAPRFELYPYQLSARSYPAAYFHKPEKLADDQILVGPLSVRGQELLVAGALYQCAMWPGTAQQKNPYFNLQLAAAKKAEFETILSEIWVVDTEMYFDALPETDFLGGVTGYGDSAWLQTHEPNLY